jgi:hypothetical protein
MGGGSSKTHQAFAVHPAAAQPLSGGPGLTGAAGDGGPWAASPDELVAVQHTLGELDTLAATAIEHPGEDPTSAYDALKAASAQARQALQQAGAAGVAPELVADAAKQLKANTHTVLSNLTPEQLQQLAAVEGFAHPTLVGLTPGGGHAHPLAHWLDPAYDATIPSKLAIQAKANERFAQLASGQPLAGLTLATVQAAEAKLGLTPPSPPGTWAATPTQVATALAELNTAAAQTNFTGWQPATSDHGAGALLAAERRVLSANCPDMGGELDAAKASAKALVDAQLAGLHGGKKEGVVGHLVTDAHAAGKLTGEQTALLSRDEQLSLLRASTTPTERAGLVDLAQTRATQLEQFKHAKADYTEVAGLGETATAAQINGWALKAQSYQAAWTQLHPWAQQVADRQGIKKLTGYHTPAGAAQTLTQEFRGWAKHQPLPTLRQAATQLGMDPAGASRAQITNFIAAAWDGSLNKTQIQAAVKAQAAVKSAAKAAQGSAPKPPPPPTPQAKTVSGPAAAAAGTLLPAPAGSFAAKQRDVFQALKAHQAVVADLPARPGPGEVASWQFGPAMPAALGGAHTKSLHKAPDGSTWMAKPDNTNHGARAHAEAAAGEILHHGGVPGVGVYVKQVGGKVCAVQPLMVGATTLPSDPKSWSQADVDAIVRYHVGAWLVGDHDSNVTNMLRTPSGGICPADHGQAFKFFGSDRLDTSYHPNSTYGAAPPIFYEAYRAAKHDGFTPGVTVRPEAALPAIRAFERMPDSQFRAILATTASEGVKHNVAWVPAMRTAAKKRLGKAHVSHAEVAEAFLAHALDRKRGLRKAFTGFFAGLGFVGAAKLERLA